MKHYQLNQWGSDTAWGCDNWYWSLTGQLGHMHNSPVASKRMPYKKKQNISLQKCLWQTHDLMSFQGRVPPSTRGARCMPPLSTSSFVSGDIASKLDTNTRTSTDWTRMLEDSMQDLYWQNQISAILHRRNCARAGGTCEAERGESEGGLK